MPINLSTLPTAVAGWFQHPYLVPSRVAEPTKYLRAWQNPPTPALYYRATLSYIEATRKHSATSQRPEGRRAARLLAWRLVSRVTSTAEILAAGTQQHLANVGTSLGIE